MKYKKYTKREMLKILRYRSIMFVETSLNDYYVIRKKDIADFMILENLRTGHKADLTCYLPGIDEPVLTTFGWFINKINPVLREEIINRVVKLQKFQIKPRQVKIFDNEIFNSFSPKAMQIEKGQVKNFNKHYRRYINAQKKYKMKVEGV